MSAYVIIVDMSAGNDSVGEMWQETHIIGGSVSLDEAMEAIGQGGQIRTMKRITITRPHGQETQS